MKQTTGLFIARLQQRDHSACQQLLSDNGPAVFRLVRRVVERQEDAEEVYQDVFVKALQAISDYDPQRSSLATWLSRIAYHEALNFVRGKRPSIVYMDDRAADISDTADDEPTDGQAIEHLEQALAQLPTHEQALISMFYYDGMSLADIAFVTGSIPSTVGSQLSRIRKKLYRIIKTMHT